MYAIRSYYVDFSHVDNEELRDLLDTARDRLEPVFTTDFRRQAWQIACGESVITSYSIHYTKLYDSLLELGVPINKLRLVYVRATQEVAGGGGTIQQAHMVLAYYPKPNADPLVLDNLNKRILPASQRHDLSPVFSFNSAGLWQGTGNQTSGSNSYNFV